MTQKRSFLLDLLKGIAIIAVVMYHVGLLKYGYLGVEVFFCHKWFPYHKRHNKHIQSKWQF